MSSIDAPSQGPGTNTGHGHVWKRPDRAVARCGGPRMCSRCKADRQAYPEPPLLDSKPPIFVEHGDRIEVTWPTGRGLFWTTPDAVEGWAEQVNQLRAERDRYRAALEQIATWPLNPGPDLLYVARKALEPSPPELHPTRRDLDRMEGP